MIDRDSDIRDHDRRARASLSDAESGARATLDEECEPSRNLNAAPESVEP